MKIFIIILIVILGLYGLLWVASIKKYSVDFGISFNQYHAEHLGLDWQETYEAMLKDLHPKYIRIAAMWNEVEKDRGQFDFSKVDWMMTKAQEYNTKVTLVIGQKAPRWPECHVPDWVGGLSEKEYKKALLTYIDTAVKQYQDHETLELWQVENEPFIKFRFGECENFREDLVMDEINLVKKLDEVHWIMVTDSGELSMWRKAAKVGDIFGSTLYRVVRTPGDYIFTYDWLPASFYRFKAMLFDVPLEKFFIAELQAEPWFTDMSPQNTPLEEQRKTMNLKRMKKHIDYVQHIGTRRAYLWGVEWWYWMKTMQNDSSYWDYVRQLSNE